MAYPKAPDKKIQKLANLLTKYVEREGVEFCFGNEQVFPMETFAHFGCLSLFLLEAKEQYEKLFNNLYTVEELMSSFGTTKTKELNAEEALRESTYLENLPKDKIFPIELHEQEEDTYFGFIPRVSQDTSSEFFLIAHFTQYTVEEYIKMHKNKKILLIEGRIPLDTLYEKMEAKLNNKTIEIIPAIQKINPKTEINEINSGSYFDN